MRAGEHRDMQELYLLAGVRLGNWREVRRADESCEGSSKQQRPIPIYFSFSSTPLLSSLFYDYSNDSVDLSRKFLVLNLFLETSIASAKEFLHSMKVSARFSHSFMSCICLLCIVTSFFNAIPQSLGDGIVFFLFSKRKHRETSRKKERRPTRLSALSPL